MTEPNTETALVVVPTPEPPPIKVNSFVAPTEGGENNIPKGKNPFYLLYKEGIFLQITTQLGRFVVKQNKMPSHLKSLGDSNGYFWWQAPNIPAEICAQIVDFFQRVFATHKTEAGVLLLMNYETKEWSVFVPTQKVTHASVEYVYEPSDIPEKHVIMGTMHSHCDFSPFHSGTDMADADDMNGVHYTIGYVNKEPKAVGMVTYNGVKWHFEPNEFADFTQLDIAKAPEEWDAKIIPQQVAITKEQEELFKKYGNKPRSPYYTSPYTAKQVDNWDDIPDDWAALYGYPKYQQYQRPTHTPQYQPYNYQQRYQQATYWEDHLDKKLVDYILDSELITDEDLDKAGDSPAEAQEVNYWISVFLAKLARTVDVLDKMGFVVDYKIRTKKVGEEDKKYNVLADVVKILETDLHQMRIIDASEGDDDKTLDGDFISLEEAEEAGLLLPGWDNVKEMVEGSKEETADVA
jgi:proteasome lid subunit RPN8/RPN11